MKSRLLKNFLLIIFIILSLFIIVSCGQVGQVSFKINFIVEGKTYSTIDTNGNELITMPTNPAKEGYNFEGWYWDENIWQRPFTANSILDAPLSSDMSVYARFKHIHNWKDGYSKDATYHWQICNTCEEINNKAVHEYGEWITTTHATENNFGLKKRICSVCGYEETAEIEKIVHTHKWQNEYSKDATYHWQTCSGCTEINNKVVHEYGEWEIITPATENSSGLKKRICSVCGYEETAEIEKTGHVHNIIIDEGYPATCINNGLTDGSHCSICGEILTPQEIIPAHHDIITEPTIEPTNDSVGFTEKEYCSVCGEVIKERSIIPMRQEANDLILSRSTLYLNVGDSYTINAIPVPQNSVISVSWNSSDNNVATVNNGIIEAKNKGSVRIIASGGGHQAVCEIIVGESKTGSDTYQDYELTYSLNLDSSAYVVTGFNGNAKNIVIPDIYDGLRVISIGDNAFKNNEYLETITLPNSIQGIGSNAFYGCSKLTTINIPASVKEIGVSAFENCYMLQSISIPKNVTNISESTFERCLSLKTVAIADGVEAIGNKAFERCASLTSIVLPNSITSLGSWAFNHAESLNQVTLSSSMTQIGVASFSGCYALNEIELPSNIAGIGASAFSDCTNLETLKILGNISTMGSSAFYKCVYLKNIYWHSQNNDNYGDDNYIFYNCGINGGGITVIVTNNAVLPTKIFEPVSGYLNLPYIIKVLHEDGSVYSCSEYLPYLITGIDFKDTVYAYDGLEHSLEVSNLPEIASVYYENNMSIRFGKQHIKAYINIGFAIQLLEADLMVYPTLTTETNINEGGEYTIISNEPTEPGKTIVLTANTNNGYTWLGWYHGETKVSEGTNLTYTFNMSLESIIYTAKWEISKEMSNFVFSYSETGITITGIKDKTVREIVVPDYVANINKGAFAGCSSLERITLPFVGDRANVTSNDRYQYPFGYIFGISSYTGGVETQQYYCYNSSGSTARTTYYIPSTLRSVTITGGNILLGVFYGCSGLTSITIPESVSKIGNYAFYGCISLTNFEIPESVTSIGNYAFYGCSSLTNIIIPEKVKSINEWVFSCCTGLTNITILGNVERIIGRASFYGCSSLTSIELPEGIMLIGNSAFYRCSSLESIILPEGITEIANSTFYECSSLTSITIPTSVKKIGDNVFYGCSSLESITLPYVISVFGRLFGINWYAGGKATNQFLGNVSETHYIPSALRSVTITGGNILYNSPFNNCSGLTSITILDGVLGIGMKAFYGCSNLTSITIPESVTSIGNSAFYGCSRLMSAYYTGDIASWCGITFGDYEANPLYYTHNLYINNEIVTDLVIPDTVTEIKDYAFYNATFLTSVIIGNDVTNIGNSAFSGCSGLTGITIPESVTSIGLRAFEYCSNLISITIPNSVTSIENQTFFNCTGLTSITIPESVTSIGEYAFYSNSSLTNINVEPSNTKYYSENNCLIETNSHKLILGCKNSIIPESVTSIGNHAFADCRTLTSIIIPNNVISIGNWAFSNCTGLTSITIPNNVTSIGNYAFSGCSGLTSITISENTRNIGEHAFASNFSLTNITVESGNTQYHSENNCLIETNSHKLLLGCKNSVIPESVTSIGEHAFSNCTGLTSITIPESVTSIGLSAFEYCSNLISITIPNSVTSIGVYAFYGCSGLTNITIPNNVTSIENQTFSNCTGLTSITIPESVTSIGEHAFSNCTGLTSITIPESVTQIGSFSFLSCSSLANITVEFGNTKYHSENNCLIETNSNKLILGCKNSIIPESVTSIGTYAFYGCSGLTSITIPESVTSIVGYGYAFYGCSGLVNITVESGNTQYYSENNCLIETNSNKLILGCKNSIIPESVTSIGAYAFNGCSGLTSITIPESVTSIGSSAFEYCSNLINITIPNNVTSIGNGAFSNCIELTSIIYQGNKKQWNLIDKGNSWDYETGVYTIYCTDGIINK